MIIVMSSSCCFGLEVARLVSGPVIGNTGWRSSDYFLASGPDWNDGGYFHAVGNLSEHIIDAFIKLHDVLGAILIIVATLLLCSSLI
jgi:hypothetical protein